MICTRQPDSACEIVPGLKSSHLSQTHPLQISCGRGFQWEKGFSLYCAWSRQEPMLKLVTTRASASSQARHLTERLFTFFRRRRWFARRMTFARCLQALGMVLPYTLPATGAALFRTTGAWKYRARHFKPFTGIPAWPLPPPLRLATRSCRTRSMPSSATFRTTATGTTRRRTITK